MRTGFLSAMAVLALASFAGADAIPTSNLVLWLKADAGVTVDPSNNVSAWADQSGQSHDGTVPAASGSPVLVSSAIGTQPAISFSGSQWLDLSGQVLTSQQFTVFTVVTDLRPPDVANFGEVFSDWDATTNSGTSVFLGTDGNGTTRTVRLSDDLGGANDPDHFQVGVGVVPSSTPVIIAGESTASDANVYINGTFAANKGSALSTRGLTTPYAIGAQGVDGFELWQGDIAEVIVYNTDLSQTDRDAVSNYLGNKYSIAVPEPSLLGFLALTLLASRRRA